ncbi:glycosyl transferase family protein [Klebsiella michiganensis]|uniref:glycosyltransferase family 4 protein n=1 Tax=Klebsiella michiganensis TaxID=1134687 RepID=UPI0007CBDE7B|nr:glycosyltransferase family 4 protein [Klebsiella michiganensis]MBD0980261.1 glycosyltransferase family 4 protein [Klebsiella michiganensis]QLO24260.1 glycosyltransferase family 4 protein [Klebsiella michiganensis]SAP41698.1 glycosyl transferase family protein [Klebsiella michiganensis]
MKVMIINTLYYPYKIGGAEVSVRLLAEGLVNLGDEVTVLSLNNKNIKEDIIYSGVLNSSYPIPNLYWPYDNKKRSRFKKILWHISDFFNIKALNIVIGEIKRHKPDIIHTNNLAGWSVSVWLAARIYKCKVVHTSRDYYLLHPNSSLFRKGQNMDPDIIEVKLFSAFKRYLSRFVSGYVGISSYIKDLHLKAGFFKKASSIRIYNPVVINKNIESLMGKTKGVKSIGFIGRLSEEKGFDIFCDIASLNSHKYNFLAAGGFSNINEKNRFDDLYSDYVHLLGIVELEDFLAKVDAVILPVKWNEPFGRVIVECAKANKIVLTSPKGGITELNEHFPNVYLSNNWGGDFIKFDFEKANSECRSCQMSFEASDIASQYREFYLKILSS